MNLDDRIQLAGELSIYMSHKSDEWLDIKRKAEVSNAWFTQEFIDLACKNIANEFLNVTKLQAWVNHYHLDDNIIPKNVGVVMAGNIPLVGFHDFLCLFISGHTQTIKLSSKDNVLLKHLVSKLYEWNAGSAQAIKFAEILKDCDAYIATGSNNSSRYFDYYFGRYPSIIRKNRTSVAILNGKESEENLMHLADDIQQYFGLGCRNVTKLFVPEGYDFVPLLKALEKYNYFEDHTKYKNNYDYYLALLIMNNQYYMTNKNIIMVENENLFSPISQLNYEYYNDEQKVRDQLKQDNNVQCIIGVDDMPFGKAQVPGLYDYADNVDTMAFLLSL